MDLNEIKKIIEEDGGKIINRTSGKSFAVTPLPKARQAIIDAGGLIPYTRKLLGATANR